MLRCLFFFLMVLLSLASLSSAFAEVKQTSHYRGLTMGTTWSVVAAHRGSVPTGLNKQLQDKLDQINALMSTYDSQSEVSRFNASDAGQWFPVSSQTVEVVALAQEVSKLSQGAFDITVGPLVELWGFGVRERSRRLPTQEQLERVLTYVGYEKVKVRNQPAALKKTADALRIDLSAVAKGYAVDQLALLLKEQGVKDFLVEVGGEVVTCGLRADGKPWRVAIEKPLDDRRDIHQVLPLSDLAMASSGNYRNFYVVDGQRYAHTINPRSGRPVEHRLAAVSVVAGSCARADALATALMALGESRGRVLVKEREIAALFQVHQGKQLIEYKSPAFLQLTRDD